MDLPRFIVDGFERQARLQADLEAVLAECLPPPTQGQDTNEDEAFRLLCTWADPAGGYRVLDRDGELAKLAEMQRAAGQLARLMSELRPAVRHALIVEANKHDGASLETYFAPGPLGSLAEIAALPERIKKARPAAEAVVVKSQDAGKMNWRAASLVGDCRDLWKRRTGRDAPRTEPKPSSAFLPFLEDVLAAFDAGRPIPAFRAWMRAHS